MNSTVYPCGVCEKPVTWEQDAICCDTCDTWNHKMCLEMSTTLFNHPANSDVSWICPQPLCNQPNYSAVLLNSPEVSSTTNPYSVRYCRIHAVSYQQLWYGLKPVTISIVSWKPLTGIQTWFCVGSFSWHTSSCIVTKYIRNEIKKTNWEEGQFQISNHKMSEH